MPYVNLNLDGLYSKVRAAKELGISPSVLWWMVFAGKLPQPEKQVGKRLYYTEDQITIMDKLLRDMKGE